MNERTYNVLFLGTVNSARSIMAEALLNALGGGRFRAYSAGSHPTGTVNPFALEKLRKEDIPTEGARSKSWNVFAAPNPLALDFVITVCDNAAGKACPVWPGQPITAHWGVFDPAAVAGSEGERHLAFVKAFAVLERRVALFTSLNPHSLERLALDSGCAKSAPPPRKRAKSRADYRKHRENQPPGLRRPPSDPSSIPRNTDHETTRHPHRRRHP